MIGMSGSGKSTLAKKLGEKLHLPVIHLDNYFHTSRNTTVTEGEWDKIVADLVGKEEWVMDGFYPRTLDVRLRAADTVIFLDIPKWLTIPRLIKAGIRGLKGGRVGQPAFLRNKLSRPLLGKVVSFARRNMLSKLGGYPDKKIIILKNNKQIKDFLKNL